MLDQSPHCTRRNLNTARGNIYRERRCGCRGFAVCCVPLSGHDRNGDALGTAHFRLQPRTDASASCLECGTSGIGKFSILAMNCVVAQSTAVASSGASPA